MLNTPNDMPDGNKLTRDQRIRMLEFHPVVEKSYVIPTKVMENTYLIVKDRVWTRRTGVFFYAPPRMGKTTCIEYIKKRLEKEFSRVYIVQIGARSTSRPSHSHMFRLILEGSGHILSNRANPDQLFNNAVTDIKMQVGLLGGSHFVVLIDELQLLNEVDLEQLLVLHNALVHAKIRMTTVSFAQPEIMHRHSLLMTAGQRQIIARFLSEPIQFLGCSNEKELSSILRAFDETMEFPENSGVTYTEFFLPEAFKYGFRLHKYAKLFWSALSEAAKALGDGMVPMEHLVIAIEHCLLTSRREDVANFVLSKDDIAAAVQAANLETFSSYMQKSA